VVMDANQTSALLVSESSQGSGLLSSRLRARGCSCSRFASSVMEVWSQLREREFDLALSPLRLRDVTLFPLIDFLEGSRTSLFFFRPVEDGCWWLPALRFGKKCFGSDALRPSEFIASLDDLMDEIELARQPHVPERQPLELVSPIVRPRCVRFTNVNRGAAAGGRIAS
jgi:hypothetical protein